jgi:tetratricopeptide (TPR) repeat protein
MKQRRPTALVLFLAAAGFAFGLQEWQRHSQAFDLNNYLNYIKVRQAYVDPPVEIEAYAQQAGLAINEMWQVSPDLAVRPRAFLIDAQRLLNDRRTPRSYKDFTRGYIYSNGMAFACQQMFIVDGSILRRSVRSFAGAMTGLSPELLSADLDTIKIETFFFFVFAHEHAHVMNFDFDLSPDGASALLAGNTALQQGNYQSAIQEFSSVLDECPAHYIALDHKAIAARHTGQVQLAADLYRRSLSINPRNHVARQNLIMTLVTTGKAEEALERIEEGERMDSSSAEYPFWRGIIEIQLNRPQTALAALLTARERYLATGDDRVVHADLIAVGVAQQLDISEFTDLLQQLRNDCAVVSSGDLFQSVCTLEDPKVLDLALQVYGGVRSASVAAEDRR